MLIRSLVCLWVSIMLVACGPKLKEQRAIKKTSSGIVQRTLVTDERVKQLSQAMSAEGIEVISVGQEYKIIMPEMKFFYKNSPRILWNSYSKLNLVIEYLKQFRIVNLTVNSYSAKHLSKERTKALSETRAREIASYMSAQGVDAGIISAHGNALYGSEIAQQSISTRLGSRLEIIFRNIIV